jgi:hypothetical protein
VSGALRERKLRRVGCEHDHDVVAAIDERTQRPVEERRAVERLDNLLPAEASRGPAREEDPRWTPHASEISTTAL